MTRKLILDVDTGTDDAVAIMLAALHPDLDLVACTTVNGNRDVEHTTDNTLRTLDHIDSAVHKLATKAWQRCLKVGEKNGWRNAQASVLAPTGTIGLCWEPFNG